MSDLASVPAEVVDEIEQIAREGLIDLVDSGMTADQALDLVAAVLDAALPLRAVLPPPLGDLAETADGPIIAAALRAAAEAMQPNPDRIEARARKAADRGAFMVAARRQARADRIRARRARRN